MIVLRAAQFHVIHHHHAGDDGNRLAEPVPTNSSLQMRSFFQFVFIFHFLIMFTTSYFVASY